MIRGGDDPYVVRNHKRIAAMKLLNDMRALWESEEADAVVVLWNELSEDGKEFTFMTALDLLIQATQILNSVGHVVEITIRGNEDVQD